MVRTVTRWTEEETALMNKLVEQYHNNFKLVASAFPSRSYNQVKSHYFNELHKNQNKSQQSKSVCTAENSQVCEYVYETPDISYCMFDELSE
ncbi:SANT/Myb_domain [Hexamita inflata]|uniref:SANT/Myb domain n=1 Tax=Hexamita inflata TaxID=28002 RepID=A0AA86NYJ6_9EUKA|nr:SANT/Myb domain [Hexamita inflata]CAI9928973.1 SANT/Myb domain [Hexamita inflata]CAI9951839.1 SANT/Myb domain [Hexamita inflata]CAI9951840.1 SANT/Myb domain [Hexamita inflata]CAI9951841.1 SANT/Myb domain [Hexamita inflata]